MPGRLRGLQDALKALQGEARTRCVGGGHRVAVLPAADLGRVHDSGAGVRGGAALDRDDVPGDRDREPGSYGQPVPGQQLLRDPVEGVRVLAQDHGGGGGRPRRHLLDDGDGPAAQLGPGPRPPLALYAVGGGGRGDDAERAAGQGMRGAAGQGGRVQGHLVVVGVVDDAVGGAGAVGLGGGVTAAHEESMRTYGRGAQIGPAGEPGRILGT
nr:MAG TPA: hypothetical protein [Caudoviricetes sp.]